MAQRIRRARPGTWHHVYNRGIGKRVIFATRADYLRFKTLMACSVRRGEIEIHAFCLLGTHFHLLVRVPQGGDLSRAMGRIQNAYTRWFNRRNRRDGPLFRGRLRSKPVTSVAGAQEPREYGGLGCGAISEIVANSYSTFRRPVRAGRR